MTGEEIETFSEKLSEEYFKTTIKDFNLDKNTIDTQQLGMLNMDVAVWHRPMG